MKLYSCIKLIVFFIFPSKKIGNGSNGLLFLLPYFLRLIEIPEELLLSTVVS